MSQKAKWHTESPDIPPLLYSWYDYLRLLSSDTLFICVRPCIGRLPENGIIEQCLNRKFVVKSLTEPNFILNQV